MPTPTSRLGLLKHTTADRFRISEYAQNWERLDVFPGWYICTSSSRPTTWGATQTGQAIYETDRNLAWIWTGSLFRRLNPSGWLGSSTRTTDIANGTTTLTTALQVSASVPPGDRHVSVTVEGPGVASTAGVTALALFRDATQIQAWSSQGGVGALAGDQPRPLSFTTYDLPVTGTRIYALKFAAVAGFGGTSTLKASATSPLALNVVEV